MCTLALHAYSFRAAGFTWTENDGVPQHDIVRKRSTRNAAGRIILETSEVANESAAGGRGLGQGL